MCFAKHVQLFAPLLFMLGALAPRQCSPPPTTTEQTSSTVILVRHADRLGQEDKLNAAGEARALALSRLLGTANLTAIYASRTNRAQDTARPLADQLGLSLTLYETDTASQTLLVKSLKSPPFGKTVLVVGHSNTVPQLLGKLGVEPALPDIAHNEFDELFIVAIAANHKPKLLKMEYGEPSP